MANANDLTIRRRLRRRWRWARHRLAFPALAVLLAAMVGLALARMG